MNENTLMRIREVLDTQAGDRALNAIEAIVDAALDKPGCHDTPFSHPQIMDGFPLSPAEREATYRVARGTTTTEGNTQ